MNLEKLILSNFRCFGPNPTTIELTRGLTACIGANGSGKTAVLHALLRLFGVSGEQRRLRLRDFHIPHDEAVEPQSRTLSIDAVFAFPVLSLNAADDPRGVPAFFQHLVADEGGVPKCRIRLAGTWTADGSLDGTITETMYALPLDDDGDRETAAKVISPADRMQIQVVYVPATRDGTSQMTAFLRGRLWRAITWSEGLRQTVREQSVSLNEVFGSELAVETISRAVAQRWAEVHSGGTYTTPLVRPLDVRFESFIRNVQMVFHPDEFGRERTLEDMSDGQRSLFHIAMTAAALDVEAAISDQQGAGFHEDVHLPVLTILAVEEPENNLSPFYLSRIVRQLQAITASGRAQALVSSHSASILARIDPEHVRYFRLDPATRTAHVRQISLPADQEEAGTFVREAVRTYPELYFARFVILGEGSSEEVVLPRLAEAMGIPIDPSFVAVVPLGGRHVNHLWRLLNSLDIPHATLLDLDAGRAGGAWGRIKTACRQLLANGVAPQQLFNDVQAANNPEQVLASFDNRPITWDDLNYWLQRLRSFGIFYCAPLDLDMSMLTAFPEYYQVPPDRARGPARQGNVQAAVLGEDGDQAIYLRDPDWEERFRWYRYLFLGRGKPSTHIRVVSRITPADLAARSPEELQALLTHVGQSLNIMAPAVGGPGDAVREP